MLTRKASFLGSILLFLAGLALGGESIPNWPAQATWSPAKAGGLGTLDVTNPMPFIGLAPCRIVDTRGNGAPIQGGIFTGGSDVRNYAVAGICGIPTSARAVSLNFTVTGPGQTTPGFLVAWPTGGAVPSVSILNWFTVPQQIANAAVVPTSAGVSITVNVSAPTHVIIDVNGYYYDGNSLGVLAPEEGFVIVANQTGGSAIYGENRSTADFSRGIRGIATGTTGSTRGVLGQTSSISDGAAGVFGWATATSGATSGVLGVSDSFSLSAAGVRGTVSSFAFSPGLLPVGVRGESSSPLNVFVGALGDGTRSGVLGVTYTTAGDIRAQGLLGYDTQTTAYGVYASIGTIGCAGCTKLFVEPHPADASKVIHYVSLEGNEAGTYFRGTTRTVRGQAVIPVPEDFRLVTDEEGLTVQLTPVGAPATMYVASEDLDQIVVHSSRDVAFHYLVQGIRPDYKDFKAVVEGTEYMPRSPDAVMPAAWPAKVKRALISNGTYNADGTVNMETARRLGWDKAWERPARVVAAKPPDTSRK